MISVLIPSRNEIFLAKTVMDIFAKSAGEVEVIVALDGYWPDPPLPEQPRLKIVHHGKPQGMRAGINHAAAIATGEILVKCDAHCMFAEGWDDVLKAGLQDNQIVMPRRKRLEPSLDYPGCRQAGHRPALPDLSPEQQGRLLDARPDLAAARPSPAGDPARRDTIFPGFFLDDEEVALGPAGRDE